MESDNGLGYIAIGSGAAFAGIMARAARWTDAEGRFNWRKALGEIVAAPCIGMMAAAGGSYMGVDYIIMSGIAAALGLVGTAAIEAIVIKWAEKKAGSA